MKKFTQQNTSSVTRSFLASSIYRKGGDAYAHCIADKDRQWELAMCLAKIGGHNND